MLIRFKKNDGTEYPQWEEHIVESQIEELSLKTTINNEYPILSSTHSGIKLQNEYFNKQTASEDNVGYKIVPYGYFTYRAMSDTGKFVFNQQTLLDKGIVSPAYPVFKVIETNADYFRYFMNESKDIKSQILILKEGSTRFALPASKLKKLKIKLPCIEEQQKIADFLSTVDQKIEAQKSIVADYEELKKGTMQKIFNQELRFRDDNGDEFPEWMEKRLGDVLNISTKSNNGKYSKEEVLSVSDKFGVVNQIKLQGRSFAGDDISKYKVVETDDIIYTKSPLLEKPFGIIKIVENEVGAVSPLYIVNKAKNGNYPLFIYYYFDSPSRTNNYLKPLIRKGAKNTMNISNEEWLSGKVKIPCFKEQKKIADCLSALDRKIEAEKKILADLEKLKKGLLQGIFNN